MGKRIVWKCQETRSEEEGFDSCKIQKHLKRTGTAQECDSWRWEISPDERGQEDQREREKKEREKKRVVVMVEGEGQRSPNLVRRGVCL